MLNSWRRWCRLCAKEDGCQVDIFLKSENVIDLAQAIQKYFLITINPYDETPTMICTNCYKFLTNLIQFAERSSKVEAIFSELIYDKFNMVTVDLDTLKFQYGLTEFIFSFPDNNNRCDQATDTNDLRIEYFVGGNSDNILDGNDDEDGCDDDDEFKNDRNNEMLTVMIATNENTEDTANRKKKKQPKDPFEILKQESGFQNENNLQRNGSKNEIILNNATMEINIIEHTKSESVQDDVDYLQADYLKIKQEDGTDDDYKKCDTTKTNIKRSKRIKNLRKSKTKQEIFKCDKCNKLFKRESSLLLHTRNHGEEMTHSCSKCGKLFPTEKRAQQHESIHLPRELKLLYPCLYCDKKFTKSVNVQAHVRAIHIGEKPFICEECGKAFGTKGALKEHKYTHVEDTPFDCPKCPKKFKNMARLRTHQDTHNDTIYVCPNCGLQLNTKRTLQMHMVVHSDQKKYKCNYCGNEYKRSKALKNHLIIHTGLKPYTCPFCDKTFANGSNCRSHKKKAHPIELAAMEAAGEMQPATNIPKLEQLKAVPAKIQSASSSLLPSTEQLSSNVPPSLSLRPNLLTPQISSVLAAQHHLPTNVLPGPSENDHPFNNQQFQQTNHQNSTFQDNNSIFEQIQVTLNT